MGDGPIQPPLLTSSRPFAVITSPSPPSILPGRSPTSIAMADSDNKTDAQLSPTQPLSSSRARELYGDNDVSSTASEADTSGHDDEGFRMDFVASSVQVAWEADDGLARHLADLKMDFYVDTTGRTALFSLRGQCTLKSGTPAAVPLFLFVYPENIQSVEVAYTSSTLPHTEGQKAGPGIDRFINLRFNMTQPASLVAPKHRPLQPKERSKALVDRLHSLATVTVVSVFLELSSLATETRAQLALLPSIFSSTGAHSRLTTPANRASLQRLYGGAGGYIVNPGTTERVATPQESQATQPGSPTQVTSGEFQEAAEILTPTQTRKRTASASASEYLPPYVKREDEGTVAGEGKQPLLESTEKNAFPGQESTQLYTPSDRKKRPRLSTTPSVLASPPSLPPLLPNALDTLDTLEASTDPQKLSFIIHQLLTRNASLEKRVQHLESTSHPLPPHPHSPHAHDSQTCHQNCRYNTSEASSFRHRIDDTIDAGLDTACSKLEDWAQLEFEEQVRAEISGQLEDLQRDLGRTWAEGIRDEVKEEVKEQVKGEVLEETAREVLRKVARGVVGALQAYLRESGTEKPGSAPAASMESSNLPGESALYAAVADVQKRYAGELNDEEMARVMDHLEEYPMSAVKYNACGEGMRRYFVGRWKGDAGGRGGMREWRGLR